MAAIQQVLFALGGGLVALPDDAFFDKNVYGQSFNGQPAGSSITLTLRANGILNIGYSATGTGEKDPLIPETQSYTWLRGGTSELYSARMRVISGQGFALGSSSVNSWIDIPTGSFLSWGISSNSNETTTSGINSVVAVLELAFKSNQQTVLADANINFDTSALTEGSQTPGSEGEFVRPD